MSTKLDFTQSLNYKPFKDLVDSYTIDPDYSKFINYEYLDWFRPANRNILKGIVRFIVELGEPGTGKTDQLLAFAVKNKMPVRQCIGNFADSFELIGQKGLESDGKGGNHTYFIYGNLLECYKYGGMFIVDESNYSPNNILPTFNQMVDDSPCFFEKSTGELIHRHPNFILAFTYNPGARGSYKEIDSLSTRVSMRLIAPELTNEDLSKFVMFHHPNLIKDFADALVKTIGTINKWSDEVGSTLKCTFRQFNNFCNSLDEDCFQYEVFKENFITIVINPILTCNVRDISRVINITSSIDCDGMIHKLYDLYVSGCGATVSTGTNSSTINVNIGVTPIEGAVANVCGKRYKDDTDAVFASMERNSLN